MVGFHWYVSAGFMEVVVIDDASTDATVEVLLGLNGGGRDSTTGRRRSQSLCGGKKGGGGEKEEEDEVIETFLRYPGWPAVPLLVLCSSRQRGR